MTARAQRSPDQPLLGFGQVRHARVWPARHAFAYPTFFLMLPMRDLASYQGPLAIDRAGAISFHQQDHGDGRSAYDGGALAWLDALLHSHGIDDAQGQVWLHCYPRVWGYTFKPVSFWYCHTSDQRLRAIVVEVNNTFGERHCYLLDNPRYGVELHASKVFHVSPFCEVRGSYRFRLMRTGQSGAPGANDTTQPLRTVVRIDHDMGDQAVLQTSISGTLHPITRRTWWRAVWGYPAMTLAVMARIHWQALRLWCKGVPFHRKPPPPTTPVS